MNKQTSKYWKFFSIWTYSVLIYLKMIWYVLFQTSVKQSESSLLLKLGFFSSWFVESRPDLVDCSYLEQDTVLNVYFYIQKTLLIVFSYLNECDFQSASDCMWGLTTIPVGQSDETPGSSLEWFVTISFDLRFLSMRQTRTTAAMMMRIRARRLAITIISFNFFFEFESNVN